MILTDRTNNNNNNHLVSISLIKNRVIYIEFLQYKLKLEQKKNLI